MKVTTRESDCFISTDVTTEPCNITEVATFIVTQSTCLKPNIITAVVGVNIASGEITNYLAKLSNFHLLYYFFSLHMYVKVYQL